jgi:diadenosine tetraphosphate (Ap4A) HIT family hydrolase
VTASPADCRFCLGNGLLVGEPILTNRSTYLIGSIDPEMPIAGMIVPFRHSETPFDINATEWQDIGEMLVHARQHFVAHKPDGFTIGWNVGAVAGQEIMHAHLHVIPRFKGQGVDGVGLRRVIRAAHVAGESNT